MRKYSAETKKEIMEICCNRCGRKITVENGIVTQGVFSVAYGWGYFSGKDGQNHHFDLCEECYDDITDQFVIPVERLQRNEII